MKVFSASILLILAFGCSIKKQPNPEELKESIKAFNSAFVTGDTVALANMITENYVHTNSSWKAFGKDQWLAYMSSRRKKIDSGELVVLAYEMDEFGLEQFENSAIVTARIKSSGIENGVEFTKQFRITNLWIYDGSRWLRAGFHDTLIN